MILNQLLLSLLLQHSYAGQTVLSVQTMPECGIDQLKPACELVPVCEPAASPLCAPPRWSTFYGAWVRVETKEHAAERLTEATDALAKASMKLLCIDAEGNHQPAEECQPIKWGYNSYSKKNRGTLRELALSGLTAMIMESSGREDVEVGRGRYKKPVDGGLGRGPSNEGCFIQVLPSEAWRYSPWLTPEEKTAAEKGLPGAREAALQKLIGSDPNALERCMEVGLRMLATARNYCDNFEWAERKKYGAANSDPLQVYWWASGMFSVYGVGPSGGCYASNGGKTTKRVRLLQKLLAEAPPITFEVTDDV